MEVLQSNMPKYWFALWKTVTKDIWRGNFAKIISTLSSCDQTILIKLRYLKWSKMTQIATWKNHIRIHVCTSKRLRTSKITCRLDLNKDKRKTSINKPICMPTEFAAANFLVILENKLHSLLNNAMQTIPK